MKKVIVTTTINQPTEAILRFDSLPDWTLIAIGDLKTPKDYSLKNGRYVSPAEQEKIDKTLSNLIGWNCIQRRNLGLVLAHRMGADIVAVVDDDNIPLDGWGENLLVGEEIEVDYYETTGTCFDPIAVTNHRELWHRGFPIQQLRDRIYPPPIKRLISPSVQADFWNGDPDIDAICRMEHAPICNFSESVFPFSSNKLSPFNSQNTFLSSGVLKDYFLFPGIGRMDDIWASFHVIANGAQVVYGKPSVYQERNVHDLTVDFKKEILGYELNYKIVNELQKNKNAVLNYLPGESLAAYNRYRELVS
jgi:hypothetical protein